MIDATKQNDAAWRERVEDKINQIQVNVAKLSESQMSRSEVANEISTRVSVDAYVSDARNVNERLTRIEASPMRMLAWLQRLFSG